MKILFVICLFQFEDAEDLLDMENKWLTFRARFNTTDNNLSMEIVRFHSTKKKTSEWRMGKEVETTCFLQETAYIYIKYENGHNICCFK
jgi:hypothetical protein